MTNTTQPGTPPVADAVAAVAVSMRGLERRFGDVRALHDFTLELAPGELVALLGPSGCGKTTALRALAGLEDIDEGSILVDGVEMRDTPVNKRGMAMVFQAYSLLPHMTVRQNVEFPLELQRLPRAERTARATQYLELVGLGEHGDRYAHQLSGGQQQRVAIARALAVHPRVLLLDEPLSALDAKVRVQLRDEIRRLQRETGITTVFVTHDQEEALAIADRVAVMRAGVIEQLGTPEEIYARPTSEFVADFIGHHSRIPAVAADGTAHVAGSAVPLLPGSAEGDVDVLVRPEHVVLTPVDEAGDAGADATDAADAAGIAGAAVEGTGFATVVSVGFVGSHVTVLARLDDGELLRATVRRGEARRLEPDARVRVSVDAAPALAVPRGA